MFARLCDYARRYLRVCIRVDAEGVTSQLYYRAIRMRWDEVVAPVRQRCAAPMAFGGSGTTAVGGLDVGVVYLVYSPTAKVWFSDALVDRESLVRILAEQTGLPWERGGGTSVADAHLGFEPERSVCPQESAVTNHQRAGRGFRSGND